MKNKFSVFLIVILFLASCTNNSKDHHEISRIQTQQLDSLLNFSYRNGMFNGAILVTKNDSIVYKKSFGYSNNESKEKITSESVFYIASVSKQFTAMGIMLLKERGELSYENKVKDIFPNYPNYLGNITIRQLLNHTSGITDTEYYKLIGPSNNDVLKILKKQDYLELENGNSFRYSNSGYVLLALIIQEISKKPISKFFNEEIFKPLGMNRTTVSKARLDQISNKVSSYNLIGAKASYKSSVIGPAGIYSTLNDLGKWNKALNNYKLVSKKTMMEAFENGKLNKDFITIKINGQQYGYGFAWMLNNNNGKKYVQHDGAVEGYRSLIKKNLTDGYDYILLTNHGRRLAMDELKESIDTILEKFHYVIPKIPIVNKIVNEILENDVNTAIIKTKNSISSFPNDYSIDENSLNRLAYAYLRNKNNKIAIAIFKLNTELFPESGNTFDSLAEGYFSNEQFKLSKENYRKSLELNPENMNAKMMIKRILEAETDI